MNNHFIRIYFNYRFDKLSIPLSHSEDNYWVYTNKNFPRLLIKERTSQAVIDKLETIIIEALQNNGWEKIDYVFDQLASY
jgi:hypothetical protein